MVLFVQLTACAQVAVATTASCVQKITVRAEMARYALKMVLFAPWTSTVAADSVMASHARPHGLSGGL
jgi:hypothetical protein